MMGGSSSTSNTKSKQQSEAWQGPWGPSQPYLNDMLGKIGNAGGQGMSPDQGQAYTALKSNAAAGDPWAQSKANATQSMWDSDRSGQVGDAYQTMQGQLGGYASGQHLDPFSNPQMQAMLDLVGNNAQNSVNAQFAGAGRDLSGYNQQAVTRGITQAQLPLLLDQYNQQQQNQMQASQMLYQGGSQAAGMQQGLDADRFGMGSQMGQGAMDAMNYSAERTIDLDQQIKGMPYEDMGMIASLLYPIAGLGGEGEQYGTGKSTSTVKTSGGLFSDARLKEDIHQIGTLADGQPLYSFRYKGEDVTHMGLMAQEVEKVTPDAVGEVSGFKTVDYDKATQVSREIVAQRKASA